MKIKDKKTNEILVVLNENYGRILLSNPDRYELVDETPKEETKLEVKTTPKYKITKE